MPMVLELLLVALLAQTAFADAASARTAEEGPAAAGGGCTSVRSTRTASTRRTGDGSWLHTSTATATCSPTCTSCAPRAGGGGAAVPVQPNPSWGVPGWAMHALAAACLLPLFGSVMGGWFSDGCQRAGLLAIPEPNRQGGGHKGQNSEEAMEESAVSPSGGGRHVAEKAGAGPP
jgi:hypothetical protein